MSLRAKLLLLGALLALAGQASAELVRLEVKSTAPAFAGRTFGAVGSYELIRAVAHYRVDPALRVNAGLVNIHKAPRDAQGRVGFDADVLILKPADMAKGNGRMLYEMVNRGRPLSIGLLNRVPPGVGRGSFEAAPEAGDGFLMNAGFTVVMSGWQAEYPLAQAPAMAVALGSRLPRPPSSTALSARLPVAVESNGSPVIATTREQFFDVGAGGTFIGHLSYPAADLNDKGTLTMRERDADPAISPPSMTWRYLDPWRIEVTKPPGTSAGAMFELVYRARDPVVYGLALASMRDLVSYLRYSDAQGNPLRGAGGIEKVIGFGASQTGRTLKELVSVFNEDEAGRVVLDGANIVISGAGRNSVNSAFARPGLKDAQHTSWGLRGDEFPFSYPVTRDELSNSTDGVLRRCSETRTCPRIVHMDSENELWHGGTLTYVDTQGRDLTMPDNVRVFVFAGTEHTAAPRPGASPPFCAAPAPAMIDWSGFARALFTALDRWVTNDESPPASRYPTVARCELVAKTAYNFPKLPEATYVGAFSAKHHYDFSHEPPKRRGSYPLLVPQADADGLMIGGVRHPFVGVPLATNAGWNVRKAGFGEGDLCMATGLHVPFPATRQERAARKDPRASIEERYASQDAYVQAVRQAAQALVKDRLLLPSDADAIVADASSEYQKALTRR